MEMRIHPAEATPFVLQMRNESVEVLPAPDQSPLDKKQYKTIKLQNGLVALLISDQDGEDSTRSSDTKQCTSSHNTTDGLDNNCINHRENGKSDHKKFGEEKIAACAASVSVGSSSNPADIQGLAHFVEHMLFMGTAKYPIEDEFDAFIKGRSGSNNAGTSTEDTTYYFSVDKEFLPEALDRFSQFFTSPLMKLESMQRERQAVESEYAKSMSSDLVRRWRLLCSLFPDGHPLTLFTTGNLKSLKEMLPSDTYLHEKAHAFRDRHYSAHRMTVAVQAGLGLETLEQLVIRTFGSIPSNHLPPTDFTRYAYSPQLITPDFHSFYYIKPVQDIRQVHLTWCMKDMKSSYESKPTNYLSHLMKNTGPGSLLAYLKKKVWALKVDAYFVGDGSRLSLFGTDIVLTQQGYRDLDQVLAAVFSYIKMLQTVGPSQELFNEIKSMAETDLRYMQESQPVTNVLSLARNMQLYPPKHYLHGDRLHSKYDPEEINYVLNKLSPETVNIIVSSKENTPDGKKIEFDRKEKWYGTEYKKTEIPTEWKQTWRQIKPYKEFHPPPKNIYIPTNFDLIPEPADKKIQGQRVSVANSASRTGTRTYVCKSRDATTKKSGKNNSPYDPSVYGQEEGTDYDEPHLLKKDDRMELWYKPDHKFRVPKAYIYFSFLTLMTIHTAKDYCSLALWSATLQQDLQVAASAANLAGLSNSVTVRDGGLTLQAHGYNQNLHLLVDVMTRRVRACSGELTPEAFAAMKASLADEYHNRALHPHKLAEESWLSILKKPYFSTMELGRALESVTFSDLQTFGDRFLDRLYARVLVQGNLKEEEARATAELARRNVGWQGAPRGEIPKVSVRELPEGVRIVRASNRNADDTNSFIANYYQSNLYNWKDEAIIEVIMMLMKSPVFDRLRTKEQLGYTVYCQSAYYGGALGYSIIVGAQADKHSAEHVDQRIEQFLRSFAQDLSKIDEREFSETKEALIKLKQTEEVELSEEVERNWREITEKEYIFDRAQRQVAAIRNLTLSDMKEWFKQHSDGGDNYRKLSVQVVGHSKKTHNESVPLQPKTNGQISSSDNSHLQSNDIADKSDNFVLDIQTYRETLPLYPDITVDLLNC